MNRPLKRASQTVVISLTLASFAATATAAQVSFWFSGVIKNLNVASNVVPSGIAEGTPFTGCVAYDSSGLSSTYLISFPSGQVGGHTIANSNNPTGYNCGLVEAADQFDGPHHYHHRKHPPVRNSHSSRS